MENESNFPLGGDIKLHTLLALPIFVGGKKSCSTQNVLGGGVEGMSLGGGGNGYGIRSIIYSIVQKWHKVSGNQVNGD